MPRSSSLATIVVRLTTLLLAGCHASSPSSGSLTAALTEPGWELSPASLAGAHFGAAVAWAGDVDGDGFGDVVACAPGKDGVAARGYLLGGSAAGLMVVPAWGLSPPGAVGGFCAAVAGAGDVNGDGYGDVVVGAPGAGKVFLYLGGKDGLAMTPRAMLEPDADAGAAVAAAGDVNRDGLADVLVGAPGANDGAGHAYLYLGDRDLGLEAEPTWDLGGDAEARFGAALAGAGDVNGDGFGDVIIGAPGAKGLKPGTGRVDLFLGSATGLASTASWTKEHTTGDGFGAAVAGAGDVNADGFADLLVGQPGFDSTGMLIDDGQALLFLGGAAGPEETSKWHVYGGESGATMGQSLAGLGDVNGDGYADVAVVSQGATNSEGTPPMGEARVYFGTKDGLAKDPWKDLGNVDTEGEGLAASGAGDIDGDGFADLVVGSPSWDNPSTSQDDLGRLRAYRGGAAGPATTPTWSYVPSWRLNFLFGISVALGDVDDDGFADALVGASNWSAPMGPDQEGRALLFRGHQDSLSLVPDLLLDPTDQLYAHFGSAAAIVGDVDGDGFPDAAVGAPDWVNVEGSMEGRVYLFRGQAGGLDDRVTTPVDPTDKANARFGYSVAAAGDVNGDGLADVVVGAPLEAGMFPGMGAAYLYLGTADGLAGEPQRLPSPSSLTGAHFGSAVAGAGDVNGDGFADVLVGEPQYQEGGAAKGKAYLYLGSKSGLTTDPAWGSAPTGGDTYFGAALAGVGDVDGDGLGDVVVAAPLAESAAGTLYLFHGRMDGLEAEPASMFNGPVPDLQLGASVAAAGDVNGDGFADFVAGAPHPGEADDSSAFLFLGGRDGVTAGWQTPTNTPYQLAGYSVAGAADVNGDGFSDIIVGAPDTVTGSQGTALLFLGGDLTPGAQRGLVQLSGDNAQRVPLGAALQDGGLVVRGLVRQEGPVGGRLQLEVEVKGAGLPFDGQDTKLSAPLVAGAVAEVTVGPLTGGAYRWRARVVYSAGSGHGRWVSYGGNPEGELDFRVLAGENGTSCTASADCTSTFCSGAVCCAVDCAAPEECNPRGTRCLGDDERPDAGVGPADGDGGSASDGDGGIGADGAGRRSYYDCRISGARGGDARWLLALALVVTVRARRRGGR